MLELKTFKGGYDSNFSYILYDDQTKDACIIDTALDPQLLFDYAKKHNLTIHFAVIMHSHHDHMIKLQEYKNKNISLYASDHFQKEVDQKLKDNEIITLGKHDIKVIHAPGHIYDCICLLVEDKLFTTDVLFIDGCGRCDFPGADVEKMYDTLFNKIMELPSNTIIYPGHDYGPIPFATLAEQKKTNHFLTAKSKEEFLKERMRL